MTLGDYINAQARRQSGYIPACCRVIRQHAGGEIDHRSRIVKQIMLRVERGELEADRAADILEMLDDVLAEFQRGGCGLYQCQQSGGWEPYGDGAHRRVVMLHD